MQQSPLQPFAKYEKFLVVAFGPATGKDLYDMGIALGSHEEREQYFRTLAADLKRIVKGDSKRSVVETQYRFQPVDVETFLRDDYFLGLDAELYPESVPFLIEMNSGRYVEVVLTGGIGSGKTTAAIFTQCYQLYLLSALRNPHSLFELDRSSEIEVIFQNLTQTLAEGVDYARFKTLILRSPYFRQHFAPDPTIKSELRFPHRIIVKPVSGLSTATIGQNVIGGLIDELNYMAVIDKSKKGVKDASTYNQAIEVYNSIARRRKSRFMKHGKMPGILCLVSSKRYPGQFTDQKAEEAKDDPTIYIYDKRVWDIKPDSFSKQRFRVFIGDDFRKPKILLDKEKVKREDKSLITEVPTDFKLDFKKDIVNALREIAGVSHLTKSPFFLDKTALLASFRPKAKSIFSRDVTNFDTIGLDILKSNLRSLQWPRFAHLDLALTGDSAGLAIGHCPGFAQTQVASGIEKMPIIRMDGVLEVRPPVNGEILFWKIRKLLYLLREMGLFIKWVTLDSFQSRDTIQVLRQKGFIVGLQSVDTLMDPYDFYKSAVGDRRIICPMNDKHEKEARELQIDYKKQRVDHLPLGSKDLTDATAGVVYGITLRRETWTQHGISIGEIPEHVVAAVQKQEERDAA